MEINWKQRALQAEKERDRCLEEIKKYREICKHIKFQLFVADGLEHKQTDELDKYRYTYP
jgi:hypothetical protein